MKGRQAILERLKAQMFMHTFDGPQISGMDDQARYDVFMTYLSGDARFEDVQNARALFYGSAPLPQALKSHHAENMEHMGRFFSQIEDPELLAKVLYTTNFLEKNGTDSETAHVAMMDLATAIAAIIAKVHGIPEPEIDREEYTGRGTAACGSSKEKTLQSKIHYKWRDNLDAREVVLNTFHEVAGHADENVQAMRSHKKSWQALDEATRQAYPLLDPKTPFARGALMLAFNTAKNHENGYYFRPETDKTRYINQVNERNARYVEYEAGQFFIEKTRHLSEALKTFGNLYNPLYFAVLKGELCCRKLAEELEDGDLKNYFKDSENRFSALKGALKDPNAKCSEDPGFRVACLELLEKVLGHGEGAPSCPFSERFSININECINSINLGGYPEERLRMLAARIEQLDTDAAFAHDARIFVPACKAA